MAFYPNSIQKVFNEEPMEGEASWESPCAVRLEGDKIRIEIEDEDETLIYHGQEKGEGHYLIRKENDPEAKLTLHQFANSNILEGSWKEDGLKGMWRIKLGE